MAQHIFSGSGSPSITPTAIGQHFIDTLNEVSYISTGTSSSSDWETSDATAAIAAHVAASDPHPQYATAAEAAAASPVQSVSGKTGVVTLDKTDVGLGNVDNTSDANKPISSATSTALSGKANTAHTHPLADLTQSSATVNQVPKWNGTNWVPANVSTGSNNTFAGYNGSGELSSFTNYILNTFKGVNVDTIQLPDNTHGNTNLNNATHALNPIANAPTDTYNINNTQVNIDDNSDGFSFGTAGQALRFFTNYAVHHGTSDLGAIEFIQNNLNIGNGTDPVNLKGFNYISSFGQINNNVNINGPISGYGFSPSISSAATFAVSDTYINAFSDNANIDTPTPSYVSANFSPNIISIKNNHNYTGINMNPAIDDFLGNANYNGLSVSPNLGNFASGGFNGINVSPNVDAVNNANGIYVSMDNVTVTTGVASSLIFQDLTLTFISLGDNNAFTFQYTPGGTAGAEVVTLLGNSITVQIDTGVSTATQVKAALDANISIVSNMSIVISGVGSNAQITAGPTNFTGGVNPGSKKAAFLDGDVEITGSLTFGGALSIGSISSFAPFSPLSGSGVLSISTLITQPNVAANATITGTDLLGLNTAALFNIGNNATVVSNFLGWCALGLPAVITMGSGSTITEVCGAAFVVSLDGTSAGGTIAQATLCKAVAIPNGITAVTRLYGYEFQLPFGDPGTTSWGFYEGAGVNNYLKGNVKIGTTDLVSNSSVALEIESTTKALLNARMTTTERNALTAINGMQLYNSTTDKLQVYAGGAWTDLH